MTIIFLKVIQPGSFMKEDLPILDAHNHGDVKIVENKDGISGLLRKSHYVWQLMRKRGVPEER